MSPFKKIIFIVSLLIPSLASAQFYVTGDDPGKLKWNTFRTDNYSIIYPEGCDSLAKSYGARLEKFRIPVSRTVGYLPGGPGRLSMPAVLHTYNTSNGSVAWAPKRMDLFTIPSAYDPEPLPWTTMLAVHESRHVAQMQFGITKAQKPFGWIFGEMWNILASLLYPGLSNIEGDAVIAETALTHSGRGRTADFLNYYKVAFDNEDFRRWDQWRLGSQRRYAPDHYALGYLTIGGFRYMYDCPMFMSEAYHLAARRPYNLAAFYTTTKKLTGKKYEKAFMEVCHHMHEIWQKEAEERAPFIPSEQVTETPRLYADYYGTALIDNDLYAIKKGHETSPSLVKIDPSGAESMLTRFAYETSSLNASDSEGILYWSEKLPDERWTMKSDSRIRYISLDNGKKKNLTSAKNLLFNPEISPDGSKAAAAQYNVNGESFITIVDSHDGKVLKSVKAPDGLQPVETAWIGDHIYVTAISDEGFGIYMLSSNGWETVLSPQPVKIKDFNICGDELMFTCDRTGVNELYHLNPETGRLSQKTVTRYGAESFSYSEDGEWLYYSSQTMKGKMIFRTPTDSLVDRTADFTILHKWPIAEKLAAQERAIALQDGDSEAVPTVTPQFSETRRYRKFPHMFNIHSWAPVYVNVDNIMNMSYDQIWQAASLGATAIMQNRLATAVGEFGYSAHKDPYYPSQWRHSGHARLTYSGFYPVLEASVNFNDRSARQWNPTYYIKGGTVSIGLRNRALDVPYIEGNFSAYIPFDFSAGGWFKGFIPKVSYKISNDRFNQRAAITEYQENMGVDTEGNGISGGYYVFESATPGINSIRHSISGSLRAYTVLPTPNSAVYPRWGIGAEVGAYAGLESLEYLAPTGYGYIYGYIPGIMKTHGIKLTATCQFKLNDAPFGQAVVNSLPRGLSSNAELLQWISIRNNTLGKFTADYAFPIYIGDLALGGNLFSIKRLVLNPHFDYTIVGNEGLFSVGSELILDLNSILTLEWPCSFGITYSFNGGSGIKSLSEESGIKIGRHFVGPTFNVSF